MRWVVVLPHTLCHTMGLKSMNPLDTRLKPLQLGAATHMVISDILLRWRYKLPHQWKEICRPIHSVTNAEWANLLRALGQGHELGNMVTQFSYIIGIANKERHISYPEWPKDLWLSTWAEESLAVFTAGKERNHTQTAELCKPCFPASLHVDWEYVVGMVTIHGF